MAWTPSALDLPLHANLVLLAHSRQGLLFLGQLKNGVFRSLVDLQAVINRFIHEHNADNPKSFIWKANTADNIAARTRGFQTLESIQSGFK